MEAFEDRKYKFELWFNLDNLGKYENLIDYYLWENIKIILDNQEEIILDFDELDYKINWILMSFSISNIDFWLFEQYWKINSILLPENLRSLFNKSLNKSRQNYVLKSRNEFKSIIADLYN